MNTNSKHKSVVTASSGQEIATVTAHEGEHGDAGVQYLTFILAEEYYGVDILRVQEIKGWTPVTPIPNSPEYLRGVLNLRGAIVPIIDLRMRFNLDQTDYTATTVVIVLWIRSEGKERTLGIVVDGVSDVLNVSPDEIKPTPDFGTVVNTEYISGLSTVNEKMIMLLDVDRLLNMEELTSMEKIQPASSQPTD